MQLNITFDPSNNSDINQAIAFLSGLLAPGERDAVRSASAQPLGQVVIDAVDDPSVGAEPKKRGRKSTQALVVEAEQAAAKETSVSAEAGLPLSPAGSTVGEGAGAVGDPVAAQPAPAIVTIDQVRDALKGYTMKNDVKAGIALLAKFGAQRISELEPNQYAAFVVECAA